MDKICVNCGKNFSESHANVLCCSNQCGIQYRQTNFDNKLRHRIGEPISDWLKRHYTFNHWTYRQICNALQINVRTLMRYMREYEIHINTPSESVGLQWVRNPKRRANSRIIAINGAPKRAEFLRRNPQPAESALIQELDKRGIDYKFQYPVNSYILDFAFPAYHLDIELDNPRRAGRNLNRLPKTQKRTAELQESGWECVYFRTDTKPSTIADAIEGLLLNYG